MNRHLTLSLAISVTLSTLAIPLRAANEPRAGSTEKTTALWTNENLEKLRPLAPISIVGQPNRADDSTTAEMPRPYLEAKDSEWYAKQAAKLRDEFEYRQAQLREYRQALDDARSLRESTGGIDLAGKNFAVTPEAGIEILQQSVNEAQSQLDALEDLARHNDIPPGKLRGQ